MNNKLLGLIFLVLLFIVGIIFYMDTQKSESTFNSSLFSIDTTAELIISITPHIKEKGRIDLEKKGNNWFVSNKNKTYQADAQLMRDLLKLLNSLKPERIEATSKKDWQEFGLSDGNCTELKIVQNQKLCSNFRIGKFSYKQGNMPNAYMMQKGSQVHTYIALEGDEKVYVVDGFINILLNSDLSDFRYQTFIASSPNTWKKISFHYPADSSFSMEKTGHLWSINNEPIDSVIIESYFLTLSELWSLEFTEKKADKSKCSFEIIIEGDSLLENIVAQQVDTANLYIIHSKSNKYSYFFDSRKLLFDAIFQSKHYFLKK